MADAVAAEARSAPSGLGQRLSRRLCSQRPRRHRTRPADKTARVRILSVSGDSERDQSAWTPRRRNRPHLRAAWLRWLQWARSKRAQTARNLLQTTPDGPPQPEALLCRETRDQHGPGPQAAQRNRALDRAEVSRRDSRPTGPLGQYCGGRSTPQSIRVVACGRQMLCARLALPEVGFSNLNAMSRKVLHWFGR